MTSYLERWGHPRRQGKGQPRRRERQERAAVRAAAHVCGPRCKQFRLGKGSGK